MSDWSSEQEVGVVEEEQEDATDEDEVDEDDGEEEDSEEDFEEDFEEEGSEEDYEESGADEAATGLEPAQLSLYDLPPEWTAGPTGSGGWVCSGRLWSKLPSRTHHRQSADALNAWKNPQGQWELTIVGNWGMRIYRFVSAGGDLRPQCVANMQLQFQPYSVARSTDGVTIVAGGDLGLLSIFTFNEDRLNPTRLEMKLTLGSVFAQQHNNMVNSVRFMGLAGKEYLIAAAQDRWLYILHNPNTKQNTSESMERQDWQQYLPRAFPPPGDCHTGLPQSVLSPRLVDVAVPISETQQARVTSGDYRSAAIGVQLEDFSSVASDLRLPRPFSHACNAAQPSACGQYIAVLLDQLEVRILSRADDFRCSRAKCLPFGLSERPAWAALPTPGEQFGGQYCAWSSASDLLAVSCDSFHAVMVYGVPCFEQLMRIEMTLEPALALSFSPVVPGMLVFCERSGRLYIIDVWEELARKSLQGTANARTLQCISMYTDVADLTASDAAVVLADLQLLLIPIGKLDGVCVTDDGRILAASREGLLEFPLLPRWSVQNHKYFPAEFKRAVQQLLLCAHKIYSQVEGITLMHLPEGTLLQVAQNLAASYKEYFPACSTRPRLVPVGCAQNTYTDCSAEEPLKAG